MREVTTEMAAVQARFAALNQELKAKALADGASTVSNRKALAGMRAYRAAIDDSVTAQGQMFARQMQITTATEKFSKRIAEQRVSFGELIRQRKLMNGVLKDQIALERASAASYSRTSSGKLNTTLYQPLEISKNLATATKTAGLWNAALASGSDQLVKWGKNTQWAGRQLMVGFTVPMAAAAIATGKLAYDIDKSLTKIVKVYGDVTTGVQESTESIRAAAMSTARSAALIYGQSAKDTLAIQGDLAAAGKSGIELQQATMATSRISVLGELEWQDAVKATISMTEVYKYSTEQLGEAFAYVNAMENQTVLTSQDFVTAIPKVAGIMNALGADLKQTGTLLTAFKAAGIDAAEGANALKSINFRAVATYGKGLDTFKKRTGQDLEQIVAETKGETIPTLERFAQAIDGLSAPDKIAVTRDVFGIYQGSKAMLLLEQMMEKSTQYTRAIDVANNSVAENAAIMQRELDKLSEAPYMRIKKAVEGLKIALFDVGEQMLKVAAPVLEFLGRIIDGFNGMSPAIKNFLLIFSGLVAMAGPLVMLTGLFANLIGNAAKFGTSIANMFLRFKITNAEERAQVILAQQMNNVWDKQTATLTKLAIVVEKLSNEYADAGLEAKKLADRQRDLANPRAGSLSYAQANPAAGYKYHESSGRWGFNGKRTTEAKALAAHQKEMLDDAYRLNDQYDNWRGAEAMQNQEAATHLAAVKTEKLVQKIGAASVAASVFSSVATDGTNAWINALDTSLLVLGSFAALAPAIMIKAATGIKAAMTGIGVLAKDVGIIASGYLIPNGLRRAATRDLGAIGTKIKSLIPMLKGVGLGFGILAGVAAFAWMKINDNVEENKKKIEDYGNAVKNVGDLLGFAYQEAVKLEGAGPANEQAAVNELAAKFTSTPENANAVEVMKTNAAKDLGGEIEGMWNEAIAFGLNAKLHGATVDQAKTAVRMALKSMGMKDMSDVDFNFKMNAMVDFDENESVINAQVKSLRRQVDLALKENASGGEGFFRLFTGGDDLTQGGGDMIRKAAEEGWNVFYAASSAERKEIFTKQAQEINRDLMSLYDKVGREVPEFLTSRGINSYSKFLDFMKTDQADFLTGQMNMSAETVDGYQQMANGVTLYLGKFMETGDVARIASNDWRDYISVLDKRGLFSETEQALDKVAEAADNAAESASLLEDALKKAGYEGVITPDRAESAWRNVFTGTMDDVSKQASDTMDAHWDDYIQGVENAGEKSVDAAEKSAEAQRKAFDKSWDKTMEAFEKKEELRREAIEKSYDTRIAKVEQAIKAEQDAEEQRKRIFDAERARIQRLSEMLNDSIDINMAINSGNLDEAAKLQNTSLAKQIGWAAEDSQIGQEDASKKRIETLQTSKEKIEEEKKAALESFSEVSEARQKALQAQQESAREALDRRLDWMKEEAQRAAESNTKIARDRAATQKASLERELATIRAYVPRNEEEMKKQIAAIDALYNKYGGQLGIKGKQWATGVAGSLSYQVGLEREKLKNDVAWSKVGADIATGMLKGAFGMTPFEFSKWLNGGTAPTNSLFGVKPDRNDTARWGAQNLAGNGGGTSGPDEAHHVGGIAGMGGARIGRSGQKKPSEIDARLLRGEGIINKIGMKAIGKMGLDSINEGRLMGMGGGVDNRLGMAGLAASMSAASVKNIIGQTFQAAAMRRMGLPTKFGANIPVAPEMSSQGIMGTIGSALGAILGQGSFVGAVRPAAGRVTSEYGPRNLLGMSFHNGIDIANSLGTPIRAVQAGRVSFSGWNDTGYGNYVTIDHGGGLKTGYGHNSSLMVKAGQAVSKGQQIARMGSTGKSTGSHSHFQTGRNGAWYNPRLSFPSLDVGGMIVRDGLANVHESEAVLTKPLTKGLVQGVENFANGGTVEYNVEVNINGNVSREVDIERAVGAALQKAEKRNGPNRKIGR